MLSYKLNPPTVDAGSNGHAPSSLGGPFDEPGSNGNGNGGGSADRDRATQEGDEASAFGPPFRVGDKVIRKKNGLCDELIPVAGGQARPDFQWEGRGWSVKETMLVNGDMGTVLDIVTGDRDVSVIVRFRTPERLCRLTYGDAHLIPAYTITVHSGQGSGFPMVIVPCHDSFFFDRKTGQGLWCRELLYTAISRAEKLLVTVGSMGAIRQAVGRKTVDQRRTRLKELLG